MMCANRTVKDAAFDPPRETGRGDLSRLTQNPLNDAAPPISLMQKFGRCRYDCVFSEPGVYERSAQQISHDLQMPFQLSGNPGISTLKWFTASGLTLKMTLMPRRV
jgi:hypothetical protein